MDTPTIDDEAPPDPDPAPPLPPPAEPGRIIGGVCAVLAGRLGVDALWVRIGFVVLALLSGVGLVAYAGLWLTLVAAPSTGRPSLRYLGGAILAVGLFVILGLNSDLRPITGAPAVVFLLIGLTLALWHARPPAVGSTASVPPPARAAPAPDRPRPRPRREPSVLGRATLGLAIAVAAAGALIDQADGGRLHPEQWLGAGAVVCGLGLLVGVVRGRARWLIVPAALFTGVGWLAGTAARVGVDSVAWGDRYDYLGEGSLGGALGQDTWVGNVVLSIDGAPDDPVTYDARVAVGNVRVFAADDVAVEVRATVDHGRVPGPGPSDDGVLRLGPDGPPDVIVRARVGRGSVEAFTSPAVEAERVRFDGPVEDPVLDGAGPLVSGDDQVGVTADGWVVLAGGAALIDPEGGIAVGESFDAGDGAVNVLTPAGEYRLLPRSLLITPSGEVLDLAALRDSAAPPGPDAPAVTVAPTTEGGFG